MLARHPVGAVCPLVSESTMTVLVPETAVNRPSGGAMPSQFRRPYEVALTAVDLGARPARLWQPYRDDRI
jgi:hypothetical protein